LQQIHIAEIVAGKYSLMKTTLKPSASKRHRQFYEELKLQLWNAGYKMTEKLINGIEFLCPGGRDCRSLQKGLDLLFGKGLAINVELRQ
jgi:hypothetical protein